MTTPLTPGVYVREAPGGARAIEAAPTAVTIFVGETERGPVDPTPVSSPLQYQRLFGGHFRDDAAAEGATARLFLPYAIQGFFDNGGPRGYVLRLVAGEARVATCELVGTQFAGVDVTDGTTTARIRARRPGADGELIRLQIRNATSGDPDEFNLTVQVSTDDGQTFPDRAAVPLYENLTAAAGDPANVATVLESDPDIEWEGDTIRPQNAADQRLRITAPADPATLVASAPGVWAQRVRFAVTDATDGDPDRFNLVVFHQAPGETAHSEVERFEGLSADPADEKYLVDQLARSAFVSWRGAAQRPPNTGDPDADPPGVGFDGTAGTGITGSTGSGGDATLAAARYGAALARLDGIDDAALIVCGSDGMLNATTAAEHNGLVNAVLAYVERRPQRDLFLVADAPRATAAQDPVGEAVGAARNGITGSDHLGLYWPRIVVNDPAGVGRSPTRTIPAAGHVAGLYGRIDGRRGVWKVAAGTEATIAGAVGLDFAVLDRDQDRMNPHGLNALRTLPGAGRVVWGGRTRRPTTEWRYINVRRMAIFLRRSIYNGIQWAVFEGNGERLWATLRETIGAFMDAQFRNGAFAGATSQDAYFVKCDADTTTPDDQVAGIVNVQVGFAPLRPAEFVIVTLSQKTAA
jgi:phage tail sheath protein FI